MTIIEAITSADELKSNDYEQIDKVRWLSELDHKIYEEVVKTHEGAAVEEFSGYNEQTPVDTTVLLAAEAYAELYVLWLMAKIDLHNSEIGKYNNSVVEFNTVYSAFERWYNRNHRPKNTAMRYW